MKSEYKYGLILGSMCFPLPAILFWCMTESIAVAICVAIALFIILGVAGWDDEKTRKSIK